MSPAALGGAIAGGVAGATALGVGVALGVQHAQKEAAAAAKPHLRAREHHNATNATHTVAAKITTNGQQKPQDFTTSVEVLSCSCSAKRVMLAHTRTVHRQKLHHGSTS